jgi:hypothetical protein
MLLLLRYPTDLNQDSLRVRRKAAPASVSTKNHEYFYPAKEVANRRYSDTTDFDDTDFEASDSDEESLQQSLQSVCSEIFGRSL